MLSCSAQLCLARAFGFLLALDAVHSFGRLADDGELGTERSSAEYVAAAGSTCQHRLNHTLGTVFYRCVVDELLELQETAKRQGRSDFYAIVPQLLDPLRADPAHRDSPGYPSDDLRHHMRDFICDAEGPGSPAVRTLKWSYLGVDPCEHKAGVDIVLGEFIHKAGYIAAGADLPNLNGRMREEDAARICADDSRCKGFTFQSENRAPGELQDVYFKSIAEVVGEAGGGWHSFKRRGRSLDCVEGAAPRRDEFTFNVDVLRDDPPVYLVHDFVSAADCEEMMSTTLPVMTKSVVSGGGHSSARRSWSHNMYPDFDDETSVVTRIARRKFAFAREVGGYETLKEGVGQEPVNAVYYKDYDDQYSAHCDGECAGGRYHEGRRIATSLTYCEVAVRGGDTLFTRSGLKVSPKPGQMLFFGYKMFDQHGKPRMDTGQTEHTGCPLREGRKWIATMWFREGVNATRDWSTFKA